MSQHDVAIEELVIQARSGQQEALADLLACLADAMRRAALGELKSINSRRDPDEVWTKASHNAQLRFTEFQGDTTQEVKDWLQGFVLREIRRPRQVSGGSSPETIGPGVSNLDTIAPTNPIQLPPSDPLTVHTSSDKTHHGTPPAAESPAAESPAAADPAGSSPPRESPANPPSSNGSEQPGEDPLPAEPRYEALDPLDTVVDLNATIPPPSPVKSSTSDFVMESFGDYKIESEIARGGMGVVYKATDIKLKREVCLKMILAGHLANTEDIERFYIEAQAAAILRHKNIVGIHQVGEHDGRHYFSMDHIQGKSLADMLDDGPLDPRVAARYLRKVAAAIQYAHDLDVLHRDLKPSNVLVDQRDEPLVTDFGLAKRTRQADPVGPGAGDPSRQEGGSIVTMAGAIMGTPGYMPPEQAAGELDEISARSDVYSLGATLYDLVTGRPPTVGKDVWDTVRKVQQEDPVPPRELNPRVSQDLDAICLKCLARDPQSRYATAQELADDLQRFLADVPVTARPASRSERAWRWCRRNPRVASLAALSLLLFVTAFAGISLGYVRTRAALADARTSIDQMRRAIDTLYTEVSETEALNEPGMKQFRRKLLGRARQLYEQALERLGDDPALKEDLAGSHYTLARILRELESPEETLKTLQTAVTMVSELLEENPEDAELVELAGRVMNLKGEVLRDTGRLPEALEEFQRAIDHRLKLGKLVPDEYEFQRQLINSQMNRGLIHKAMYETRQASEDFTVAMQELTQSQEDRESLVAKFPAVAPMDARIHFDSAMGAYNLAQLKSIQVDQLLDEYDEVLVRIEDPGDGSRASESLEELEMQLEQLVKTISTLEGESQALLNIAFEELDLLDVNGNQLQGVEGLDAFRTRFLHALCLMLRGKLPGEDDTIAESQESHQQAADILSQLLQDNPTVHWYRAARAGNYMESAPLWEDPEAIKRYDLAIDDFKELAKQFPGVESYPEHLANAQRARTFTQKRLMYQYLEAWHARSAIAFLNPFATLP